MGNSLKKEKAINEREFEKHHHTRSDDVQKGDDVKDSNDIENHISWTGQGTFEEAHYGRVDCPRRPIGSSKAKQERVVCHETERRAFVEVDEFDLLL